MRAYVAGYLEALGAFEALGDPPPQAHAAVVAAATLCNNFYVHYAVEEALPVQRRAGALLSRLVRAVEPAAALPARPVRERPRVVFVSSFIYLHSVGKLFERLLTGLDRSRIEVQVVAVGRAHDALTARVAAAADGLVNLRRDVAGVRAHLQGLAADVVVWLDIGMDAMLGWVAAQRVAPVQCVRSARAARPTTPSGCSACRGSAAASRHRQNRRRRGLPGPGRRCSGSRRPCSS